MIFPKTTIFQLQNGIFTSGVLPIDQKFWFFEILSITFPKRCVFPYSENLSKVQFALEIASNVVRGTFEHALSDARIKKMLESKLKIFLGGYISTKIPGFLRIFLISGRCLLAICNYFIIMMQILEILSHAPYSIGKTLLKLYFRISISAPSRNFQFKTIW